MRFCCLFLTCLQLLIMLSFPEIEQESSPVGEMGDTLEFSDIYQEVKGSWVSIVLHRHWCNIKNRMYFYVLLFHKTWLCVPIRFVTMLISHTWEPLVINSEGSGYDCVELQQQIHRVKVINKIQHLIQVFSN